MADIIAYCGLYCNKCGVFIATQKNDLEEKKRIAERWTKSLNTSFKPEDITCDGCFSKRLSAWCTRICKIRPCAEEKKVKTCAHCPEYQCDRLKKFLKDEPEATKALAEIHKTI